MKDRKTSNVKKINKNYKQIKSSFKKNFRLFQFQMKTVTARLESLK